MLQCSISYHWRRCIVDLTLIKYKASIQNTNTHCHFRSSQCRTAVLKTPSISLFQFKTFRQVIFEMKQQYCALPPEWRFERTKRNAQPIQVFKLVAQRQQMKKTSPPPTPKQLTVSPLSAIIYLLFLHVCKKNSTKYYLQFAMPQHEIWSHFRCYIDSALKNLVTCMTDYSGVSRVLYPSTDYKGRAVIF
jgi:hypothetical protein